jgi:hypothetical protein
LREFEGVLVRNPQDTIGIFSSFTGYTRAALVLAMNSAYPLICCQIVDSKILSFHINHRTQRLLPELTPGKVKAKKEIEYLVYTTEKGEIITINS